MNLRPVDDDWNTPEAEDPDQWCARCGEPLPQPHARTRRFCSRKCKKAHYHAEDSERRRKARAEIVCAGCGTIIRDAPSAKRKYCTARCSKRARKRITDAAECLSTT